MADAEEYIGAEQCIGAALVLSAKCILALVIFCIALPFIIYINTKPEITLQNFYVPSLSTIILTPTNATPISYFDLALKNMENDKGVQYDHVNITFSYGAKSSVVIGSYVHKGFYQGRGKTAHVRDVMFTTGDGAWLESATRDILSGSTAKFTVDVATKVKFKFLLSYSNKRSMVVRRKFEVDGTGKAVPDKNSLVLKLASLPRKMLLPDLVV